MTQNMKDLQECVATMRDGSKSFFAASRILPQRVRDPATALYAFCRITDDIADAVDAEPDAIPKLRERLDRIYQVRQMIFQLIALYRLSLKNLIYPSAYRSH